MTDINEYKPWCSGTYRLFTSTEDHCTHIAEAPNGKKYYARYMKGAMSEEGSKGWTAWAAREISPLSG